MPELPEVETIVRELAPKLIGKQIISTEILHPRATRLSRFDVPSNTAGKRITRVARSGKFIEVHLDHGCLTLHLGMTGKLLFDSPRTPYTRAIFQLENTVLMFDDIRTFGSVEWAPSPDRTAALGPEPLLVDAGTFYSSLQDRKAAVKALLLNQRILRGIGNIYADEALFRARIRPTSRRLSRARADRLLAAIQDVLAEAISFRGSSISDYVDTEGRSGGFQQRHNVYGREGLPCFQCGTPVKKIVLAQRGTHFCPSCQKA